MRGHLDRLDRALHGWVVDSTQPEASLDVTLLVDGVARARGRANLPRPDVAAAGLGARLRQPAPRAVGPRLRPCASLG